MTGVLAIIRLKILANIHVLKAIHNQRNSLEKKWHVENLSKYTRFESDSQHQSMKPRKGLVENLSKYTRFESDSQLDAMQSGTLKS